MADGEMRINIHFDVGDIKGGISSFRKIVGEAIDYGVFRASQILLRDCRPYIPMLTGRLRDSGKVLKIKDNLKKYAYQLIWDAANPKNKFVYAKRQYSEVFQHVDGKYASKWVERTLKANPDRYIFLCARYTTIALNRSFRKA